MSTTARADTAEHSFDEPLEAPPATRSSQRRRQPRPLAGLGHQLRFMMRRDRVRAPIWILSIVGLVGVGAASVIALYSTPEELENYRTITTGNPALRALAGPGYGLDDPTQGAVVMNETSLYTYVGVALMCIFMFIRHTRAEEEGDRAELVRAAPVGRYATMAAAAIWITTITAVISIGCALSLIVQDLPAAGSTAFGAAIFASGLVFTGVAAVTAQVGSNARSATAIAGGVLGLSFMLRAVGDMGNGWMTWLSPLGVAQAIRPYADERWWVLIPLLVIAVLLIVAATVLAGERDLGAGILRQQPGPANGTPRLATPLAMAVRLQRGSVIGWLVGVAISGVFFGLVSDQAEEIAANEAVAEMLAAAGQGTVTESLLATVMLMMALVVSGFTVSSVLRLRSEEIALRAEPILATPVDRRRWLWSHYAVSLVGSVVMMVAVGLTTGLGFWAATGDAGEIGSLIVAGLSLSVGLAVFAAVAFALVAVSLKWAMLAWAMVAVGFVVGLLSSTLDLPQWARDISPFTHIPAIPAVSFDLVPILILTAIAAGFTAVGMVAIRHRDIG